MPRRGWKARASARRSRSPDISSYRAEFSAFHTLPTMRTAEAGQFYGAGFSSKAFALFKEVCIFSRAFAMTHQTSRL